MNCKEIEQQILSGERLSPEAERHLLHCRSCQQFSSVCFLLGTPQEPSGEIDRKILAGFRRQHPTFFRSYRHFLYTSAAAAILVLLGLWGIPRLFFSHANGVFPLTIEERWQAEWTARTQEIADLEMILTLE